MPSRESRRGDSQVPPRTRRSVDYDVGDAAVGMLMARRAGRGVRIGGSGISREETARRLVRIARALEQPIRGAAEHWRQPYAKWLRDVARRIREENADRDRLAETPYRYDMGPFDTVRGPSTDVLERRAAVAAIVRAANRTGERPTMRDMAKHLTAVGHHGGTGRERRGVTAKDIKNDLAALFPKRTGRRSRG